MSAKLINLSEFRDHFKDEAAYLDFIDRFEVDDDDFHILLDGEKILCATISSEVMQEFLCKRVVTRLSESPDLLEDLQRRMDNDQIVD